MTDTTVTYTGGWSDGEPLAEQEQDGPVVKLLVTPERTRTVNLGVYRGARKGDQESMLLMAGHFMVNGDGEYVNPDEADAMLNSLTVGDLWPLIGRLIAAIQEGAAPKTTG